MTTDQTRLDKKSKRLTNRQPPIAQLVERSTVEKLIPLGPWFESGTADGRKNFSSKQNLTNILEDYFLKIQSNFHY